MKCCVANCENRYRVYRKNKSFFSMKSSWLEFCNLDPSDRKWRNKRVCEDHFRETDFVSPKIRRNLKYSKKLLLSDDAMPVYPATIEPKPAKGRRKKEYVVKDLTAIQEEDAAVSLNDITVVNVADKESLQLPETFDDEIGEQLPIEWDIIKTEESIVDASAQYTNLYIKKEPTEDESHCVQNVKIKDEEFEFSLVDADVPEEIEVLKTQIKLMKRNASKMRQALNKKDSETEQLQAIMAKVDSRFKKLESHLSEIAKKGRVHKLNRGANADPNAPDTYAYVAILKSKIPLPVFVNVETY